MDCVFCKIAPNEYLAENRHFYLINDKYPVSRGHLLVISKRHFADFFAIAEDEMADLREIVLQARSYLQEHYQASAFNLGMNCGKAAGQSVDHFHLHIIPRYSGDRKKSLRDLREFVRDIL